MTPPPIFEKLLPTPPTLFRLFFLGKQKTFASRKPCFYFLAQFALEKNTKFLVPGIINQ